MPIGSIFWIIDSSESWQNEREIKNGTLSHRLSPTIYQQSQYTHTHRALLNSCTLFRSKSKKTNLFHYAVQSGSLSMEQNERSEKMKRSSCYNIEQKCRSYEIRCYQKEQKWEEKKTSFFLSFFLSFVGVTSCAINYYIRRICHNWHYRVAIVPNSADHACDLWIVRWAPIWYTHWRLN